MIFEFLLCFSILLLGQAGLGLASHVGHLHHTFLHVISFLAAAMCHI